eukprot:3604049-Rhodomonas_salina.1
MEMAACRAIQLYCVFRISSATAVLHRMPANIKCGCSTGIIPGISGYDGATVPIPWHGTTPALLLVRAKMTWVISIVRKTGTRVRHRGHAT